MARVLVTGGTGFIGAHLVRALLARGDEVRATVRPTSRGELPPDVEPVTADVTDRRAVRRAVRGVERVFHVAGTTRLGLPPAELLRIHVDGTRAVLDACLAEGVARVVHVSSVAAIGPARPGGALDERHVRAGPLGIPYADAKHAAEVEALRVAAHGLEVVVACPAHVFGRGDERRSSTEVVRRFLLRRIPAYVDGALNIVDVEDVAAGLLLCDERGVPGERYIFGTRNYTWQRLFGELQRISGVEGPVMRVPRSVALALAEGSARLPGFPALGSAEEIRAAGQWWTYRSAKARRELGWTTRPHEDTVEATVRFHEERLGDRLLRVGRRQPLAWRIAGRAVRGLVR
ncbi:MAG TPA: NAD-dependent epimerase/dehydratase family protein [Solirubrobacteraceae bacterium]|nr:NAD-dependent epimerase/dehydratase family protein [Solirubrobacteraceae bacterium]